MDEILCLKYIIACCEESINNVLFVKNNEFSIELFGVLLKKNIYESITADNWEENIYEKIDNMKINYDFINDLESDESLQNKIDIDLTNLYEMDENDADLLLNNLEELIETGENIEVNIDIPLASIIEEMRNLLENGDPPMNNNPRDILRDINIIDEMWESWSPYDSFAIQAKNMADYLLENIKL